MNSIQQLKERREKLVTEMEANQAESMILDASLHNEESPPSERQARNILDELRSRKRRNDAIDLEIHLLDQRLNRREGLANRKELMTGYLADMACLAEDERELNVKRGSLITRLDDIRKQAQDNITKARQAETQAATAYAQAVAWGDVESENAANADAQKAAKHLATASEHYRRQQLIITALDQELITVDQHIDEAQKKRKQIEHTALHLAHDALEEQWNEATQTLLHVGGQLWASYRLIDSDPVMLRNLNIPGVGEDFKNWTWRELLDNSYQYNVQDLLKM